MPRWNWPASWRDGFRPMRARKRFGQHFLVDEQVLDQIVRSIAPAPRDRMLEIGPGRGALTELLCAEVDTLDAVELDRDLIASLQARFSNLRLTQGDVLATDFATLLANGQWRLVGNLPYNLSSPLLLKLAEYPGLIRDMHFMLQKELAERLAASPGSKAWGRLSVMLQLGWEIETLMDVAPSAFNPPPRVMSQVVRLTPRKHAEVVDNPVMLSRLVAAAFGQRRKTLNNSLKSFALDFEAFGLTGKARAEDISVVQFVAMANSLGS